MTTTNERASLRSAVKEGFDTDRSKSCSCNKIIYNDIEKWFMEDLAFKSLYTSCKERPDLQENKITKDSTTSNNNFLRILKKILDAIEATEGDEIWFPTVTVEDGYLPEQREWYHKPCENQIDIYDVTEEQLRNGIIPDEEFYAYTESCDLTPGVPYLVKSAMITYYFNFMTSNDFIAYTLDVIRLFPTYGNTLKKKLLQFKQETMYNSKWRGANYYYKMFFGKPIYLHDMEIPQEILDFRDSTYFHDMICGHPKASHGWAAESLQELRDLNLVSF